MKLWILKQKLISKHITINDNAYSNPYDRSNNNNNKKNKE